jgi:lysophospholipase L1-like esterase
VAAALAADVVVIQTGVNDLQIVTHFADDARVVERCRGNLERLAARARAGGAAVVVTTIFPVGEAPATWFSPSTTQVNADIRRVNDGIHSMSGDGVFVLDAHALLQDARGLLPERHAADWLHLNSKGYAVLNLELVRLLSEIGRSAP